MEDNKQNIKFKTTINCSGCVAAVKPHLEKLEGLASWTVDTDDKDKILSVSLAGATGEEVVESVKKAGFQIEPIAG